MTMRTLILADRSFALREQPMLSRLEVGLAGEGVRVVQAVPEECLPAVSPTVVSPVIGYEEGMGRLTRRGRARRLAAATAAAMDVSSSLEEPWLDVVHCFGYPACDLAVEVARQTGAAVAVEVWSGETIVRARELMVARAGRAGEPPAALFAAGSAVAREIGGRAAAATLPIEVTPWGVHASPMQRPPIDLAGPVSAAVLLDGVDARAVHALLDGLGDLAARYPNLLLFFDADGAARLRGGHGVWKRAKALGILDRLSMVGSMEGHREPILHVDMLLQPEAVGAHHSLTLDAMAAGVAVVAREDALVDHLIDGRTASLVRQGTAEEWSAAIERLMKDPQRTQGLRASAREYVRELRSAMRHVESVQRGYERLAAMRAAV